MKKFYYVVVLLIVFNAVLLSLGAVYVIDNRIELKSIKLVSYDDINNSIKVKINTNHGIFFNNVINCKGIKGTNVVHGKGSINECLLDIPVGDSYSVTIFNDINTIDNIDVLDYLNNRLDFKFNKDKIYLLKDDKVKIDYTLVSIDNNEEELIFKSDDENVVKIEDDNLIAVGNGRTKIYEDKSESYMEVVVTDLISKPTLSKTKKTIVPCHEYTEEEAMVLDEYLDYYVKEAGEGTRAGVVAAGRFLTLQFKYRVPYFYENGRTNKSGVRLADGEGRYYKKGLYLDDSKFSSIKYSYKGPSTWGCPLTNLENDPKHGYIPGRASPNGLDCSGFVTWAFVNGGFDPGDVGAGENEGIYQMTDTGKYTALTYSLATSGKIKTGDLFNFWGHIALIIGQDDENFYVAESLPYLGGVICKTYKKTTVHNTFDHVVLMDSYYKEDGNLTDYWN